MCCPEWIVRLKGAVDCGEGDLGYSDFGNWYDEGSKGCRFNLFGLICEQAGFNRTIMKVVECDSYRTMCDLLISSAKSGGITDHDELNHYIAEIERRVPVLLYGFIPYNNMLNVHGLPSKRKHEMHLYLPISLTARYDINADLGFLTKERPECYVDGVLATGRNYESGYRSIYQLMQCGASPADMVNLLYKHYDMFMFETAKNLNTTGLVIEIGSIRLVWP